MSLPLSIVTHDWVYLSAALLLLVAITSKYIYRLTLHPLAGFPGPKLAAATSLYGAFFDLRSTTSYLKVFPTLHEEHGHIIRVWPDHLHVNHIDAYNQIFKFGSRFDKDAHFLSSRPLAGGFTFDPSPKHALIRRNMFGPSFTRDSVRRAEPRIAQSVLKFLDRLKAYSNNGKHVNMTNALRCLMADGVMNFAYQMDFGALETEEFESERILPVVEFMKMLQWAVYLPKLTNTIFELTNILPLSVLRRWLGGIVSQMECLKTCHSRITYLAFHHSGKDRPSTVFDTTLNPNIEKGQYTPPTQSLAADAFTFMMAGTDTTSGAMVVALFNLLDGSPHMLERLKKELCDAIPDVDELVKWEVLEKLPYLRAVIKESLRLSYGVSGRLPRLVPREGAALCGRKIPGGTSISSSIYVHNMNPTVFLSPHDFRPERWSDADPVMEANMVSFGRGPRACLGINLAQCEIYLTLAHLLRRFNLQLDGTTKEDMEWKDCMTPVRKGSLKVLLTQFKE